MKNYIYPITCQMGVHLWDFLPKKERQCRYCTRLEMYIEGKGWVWTAYHDEPVKLK